MRKKFATRICAIAMAAAMVAGVAGCGNDSAEPSGSASGGSESSGGESSTGGEESGGAEDQSQETPEETYDFGGAVVRVNGGIFGDLNEETKLDDDGNVKQGYTKKWDIAHQLEAKYNIKIEYVNLTGDDGYETGDKILATFTNGECFADIFTVGDDLVLSLKDYLADITADVDQLKLGSAYVTPGTWMGKVYGWTYDNMGSSYVLVYSREYLQSIGMEKTPTDKFMAGEWSYDDCIEYLTEMKSKLPDGTYPISVHPNHWVSMAPGANGTVSIDSNGEIHMADEAYIEALEFYTKLQQQGLAPAATNVNLDEETGGISADFVYQMQDMCGPTEAKTFVLGMVEAWQYGDVKKNVGDWGIVPWPWGSQVTCSGDYKTLSDTYLVPQSIWTDVVVPKAEYSGAGAKEIPDIILHQIARDFCDLDVPDGQAARTAMWEAESKGETYVNMGYDPGDPGHFCNEQDIEVFDWLHSRSTVDWGHAFNSNGVVRVNRNGYYVIAAGRDARSTGENFKSEGDANMKDQGFK